MRADQAAAVAAAEAAKAAAQVGVSAEAKV
jgi:hypothetical protein